VGAMYELYMLLKVQCENRTYPVRVSHGFHVKNNFALYKGKFSAHPPQNEPFICQAFILLRKQNLNQNAVGGRPPASPKDSVKREGGLAPEVFDHGSALKRFPPML